MMSDNLHLVAAAVGAGVVCALLVPAVRHLALMAGAVDVPDARRVHARPTPRLGGLAVVGSAGVCGAAALLFGKLHVRVEFAPFLGAVALVLGLGVVDDLRGVRARFKLLVEVAAALLVVYAGDCRMSVISVLGTEVHLGPAAPAFSVLWIVVATNAINLIDGLDGLAAGTGAIAFGAIAVIAVGFTMPHIALLASIWAGSCLGFLAYNRHPASIFLGDSGSLPLGFVLGVLSMYARAKGTTGAITLAPLLLVAWPLSDLLLAVSRRYRSGLAEAGWRHQLSALGHLFQADRNHIHHRLLALGLRQQSATFTLWSIQILTSALAIYFLVGR